MTYWSEFLTNTVNLTNKTVPKPSENVSEPELMPVSHKPNENDKTPAIFLNWRHILGSFSNFLSDFGTFSNKGPNSGLG